MFFSLQILLACSLQLTSAVNLVVIRDDDSASKSVEDEDEESDESSDSDETRDIDMLVDLIEKSTNQNQRKTPPVRTVRVVRRKPASKVAQASTRKERIQQSPKQPKEYHVHYHTHQHPKPPESADFEEDRLKPMLWESLSSHLNTYQDIYRKPKTPPLMSLTAAERFKQFKDFETLLQNSKKGSEKLPKFYDGSSEFPDHFDDAIVQHPPSPEKTANELNRERLKRYQALLRSRFRTQPQKTSKENDDDFPNRARFAGFTDFSTLESSQPKQPSRPKEVQKPKEDTAKESDDLEIRDFAIVIKTKPRTPPQKKDLHNEDGKDVPYRMMDRPSNRPDQERPDEPRTRRPFGLPRILDSPGGAPQFIEKLHQAKYGRVDKQNLNSIESRQRQRFLMRPGLRPGFGNHVYNGWIIQRWLR